MKLINFEDNRTTLRIPHTITFKVPTLPKFDTLTKKYSLFMLMLILITTFEPVFAVTQEEYLTQWWKFEDDLTDEVTTIEQIDMTNNGGAFVTGLDGKGLDVEFDESDYTYHDTFWDTGVPFDADGGTISFWWKPESYTNQCRPFHKITSASPRERFFMTYETNGKMYFSVEDSGYHTIVSDTVLPLDEWTLVTVTWDTTDGMKMYLNTSLQTDTDAYTGTPAVSSPADWLLSSYDKTTSYCDGVYDDFRIYNKTLTLTDVQAIWAEFMTPDSYGNYSATQILDNSSLHLFPFNTSQNLNFTAYNATGYTPQQLNISIPDISFSAINYTAGEAFPVTFNNSNVWNYSVIVQNFYNSSVNETFYFQTHRINNLTINTNQTFFKFNTSANLNTSGYYVNGSLIYYTEPINYTISDIGYVNVPNSTNVLFPITLNDSSTWNHTVIANWTRYNLLANDTHNIYSSVYNISSITYSPTVAVDDTQFINVSVGQRIAGTGQVNNVSMVWNGTTYYLTEWATNEWYFTNTPTTTEFVETVQFTTYLNTTYNGETLSFSNTSSQVITTVQLDDCTTFSNQLLNITLYDERDRDFIIINSSLRASFDIYGAYIAIEQLNDTDGIFGVCINNSVPFVADVDFSFFALGWVNWGADTKREREHFYFDTPFNTTTIQQGFYKLEEAYAEKIIFNLVDSTQSPLDGYYITLKRWYGDGYETVAMAKTDVNGQAITYIEYNDPYYAFDILDEDGELVYETDRIILTTTPTTIQVPTSSSLDYFSVSDDFTYTNAWSNSTEYFSTTIVNTNGVDTVFDLLVYYSNGSLICSKSSTTSSWATSCSVTGWENSIFIVRAIGTVNGQTVTIYNYLIDDTTTTNPVFEETEGIIWLFFIMVIYSMTFVGIAPTLLPLSPALALLTTNLLTITSVSIFVIGGLAMAGFAFMLWFMRS